MAGTGIGVRGRTVALWSLVEGIVPLVRPRYFVGDAVAFRGPPIAVRLGLGLEVSFGLR